MMKKTTISGKWVQLGIPTKNSRTPVGLIHFLLKINMHTHHCNEASSGLMVRTPPLGPIPVYN